MEDEGKKSYFNAGMAQADRVDTLQRVLNWARFNPLGFNTEFGRLNYEVMVFACHGLLKECWGKITENEKVDGQRWKNLIESFLEVNPIITKTPQGEPKVNNKNLKDFMKLIDLYENKIRVFLEEHDMNSPNKEIEDDDEL